MQELINQEAGPASRSEMGKATDKKFVLVGTHRVRPPEETLARVEPFLPRIGITRVAEITQLDELGIPVFQAIRPNSRNVSVSQGKGITKLLAKVSAIMESIESWHAEQPELASTRATIGEMASHLPYSIYDLNLSKHHLIHDNLELEWFPARRLDTSEETFVPADYIRLDFTTTRDWLLPTFYTTSNGLASGNILEEAILHGLYEVIERDTFERARIGGCSKTPIDPSTVDGAASASVLELLWRAKASVEIFSAVGPTGIGCFEANITSPTYPIKASGYGCHLDRDVALSRALTEAAQSRLSIISGARDDIRHHAYVGIRNRRPAVRSFITQPLTDFRQTPSAPHSYLTADLNEVIRRVCSVTAPPPLVVDLTRQELNIPVAYVIVPTFRFLETLQ